MLATQPTPAPATTRRRLARAPSMRRLFLVDFLDLEEATGVPGARWEFFQLDHLDDDRSVFRIENKSRQIAWSWLTAAEAVADAAAGSYTGSAPRDSIFVSINQDEAAEKIRYAKRIYLTLIAGGADLPRLTTDNALELGFSNGARLESLPARPPRGRARSNVYMDEFAHVRGDAEIYTAALPIISKGGRLRIGSSPFGAGGRFWEIVTEAIRPYPDYVRRSTPWWQTYAFCSDPVTARRTAPAMETAERMARFGNERIKVIFANMPQEDFRQEYECHRAGTLVLRKDGLKIPFIELDSGDELLYSDNGELKPCTVKQFRRIGVREIIEVTTEAGTTFAATRDHQVRGRYVKQRLEWASHLTYAFVPRSPAGREEALARIVGFNLGDGTISQRRATYQRVSGEVSVYAPHYQASFYAKDRRDLEWIARDFVQAGLTDTPPNVLFKKGGKPAFDAYQMHANRKTSQALVDLGCVVGRKVDADFSIPDWIADGPQSVKAEFLAALFGAEGNTPRIANVKLPGTITFAMHKSRLAPRFFEQIGAMLGEFGIRSTVTKNISGPDRIRYAVHVNATLENSMAFFSQIGYRYAIQKEENSFLWIHYLMAYYHAAASRRQESAELHAIGLSYTEIGEIMQIDRATAHRLATSQRPARSPHSFPTIKEWAAVRYDAPHLYLFIKERRSLGEEEVFNIEVDSPDHSYLLADGLFNYNCEFVDETRSYFTWEEIRAATDADLYTEAVTTRGAAVDGALQAIRRLEAQIARGNAETVLAAGYDVGRTRNTSELIVVGLSTTGSYPTRAILTLDETPYDAQRDVLLAALTHLPILRLWIDRNGIGSQIAEEIERAAPAVAAGQNFTVQSKQLWATTAKRLIQQRRAILPANRDLAYQIHSIRKLIGAGRQNIFDTTQDDKHHADKAWSLFLALSAADAGRGQADAGELAELFGWRG